jgi:cytochrome c biogenesis protein
VGTRSRDPNNPAVLLELYEGNERKYSSWAFMKYPDFHGSGESDYLLKFLSIGYYTGLQISYDPGLSIIWFGCLLMVVGMFLSFYLSYKRIWVRLSAGNVELGGRSYKNRSGFEKEFSRLKSVISDQ